MAEGRDTAGRFVAGAAHPRMGGRHKSPRRIEAILQRIGEEELVHQGETITKLEAVLRAVFGYALKGQSWAVQFIAERTEGKVRDQIQADVEVVRAIKIIDYDGDPTPSRARRSPPRPTPGARRVRSTAWLPIPGPRLPSG